MQRQLEHTEGRRNADLAVRSRRDDRGVIRAAGAGDELANAGRGVRLAGRRLRREALVDVVVAIEDDVRVRGVQQVPEGMGVLVCASAGAEERDVPVREQTLMGMRGQVGGKPVVLRAPRSTAAGLRAVRVQSDEMPAPDVEAVPPLTGVSLVRCACVVAPVARGVLIRAVASRAAARQVLVVPHRRVCLREKLPPREGVRLQERLIAPAVVLVVAQRENGNRIDLLQHRVGRQLLARAALPLTAVEVAVRRVASNVARRGDHRVGAC